MSYTKQSVIQELFIVSQGAVQANKVSTEKYLRFIRVLASPLMALFAKQSDSGLNNMLKLALDLLRISNLYAENELREAISGGLQEDFERRGIKNAKGVVEGYTAALIFISNAYTKNKGFYEQLLFENNIDIDVNVLMPIVASALLTHIQHLPISLSKLSAPKKENKKSERRKLGDPPRSASSKGVHLSELFSSVSQPDIDVWSYDPGAIYHL